MSIEGTLLVNLLAEQQETNELLREIRDLLAAQGSGKKNYGAKYQQRPPLSEDDKEALDEEVDLDWWFSQYGDLPRPAKYMNKQGLPYSKEEQNYLYRRMLDIAGVGGTTEDGKFVLVSLGKVWCKPESNAANCFAMRPVTHALDQMKAIQEFEAGLRDCQEEGT